MQVYLVSIKLKSHVYLATKVYMVLNMFLQFVWNEKFLVDISIQLGLGMVYLCWRTLNFIIDNIFKSCYPRTEREIKLPSPHSKLKLVKFTLCKLRSGLQNLKILKIPYNGKLFFKLKARINHDVSVVNKFLILDG